MSEGDVPVVPAQSVEVCESYHQTVCPVVVSEVAWRVTAPSGLRGQADVSGRIVRFEPVNAEMGAWVLADRTGGQVWYPLRSLTLVSRP